MRIEIVAEDLPNLTFQTLQDLLTDALQRAQKDFLGIGLEHMRIIIQVDFSKDPANISSYFSANRATGGQLN